MIDIHTESLLSLAEAAKLVSSFRAGMPTAMSTIHRWVHQGVRGVQLESLKIGERRG